MRICFSGRRALYELLVMTDELRDMVLQHASAAQLQTVARERAGLVLMRDVGWDLCRRGITTPDEVLRVTKI